ncbi:MAG: hypothetical protein M9958_11635 [Chitinophagales bacterium]|nr:hypothetical protein [Chitinophagales bacterium]
MNKLNIPDDFGSTLFYYQIYKPDILLHVEIPSLDLGIYQQGVFTSILNNSTDKFPTTSSQYQEVPKIKTVIFLDALYKASKGMEPFLSISTRLFKLIVDSHQKKAETLDLDIELYTKIKTIYWEILQENATDELINKGFEVVVQEAIHICTEWIVEEVLSV